MTSTMPDHDRRRRDLASMIARATWPLRYSVSEFIDDLPCNVIGHKWVEIPGSLLTARERASKRLRFSCARCFLRGGFSS